MNPTLKRLLDTKLIAVLRADNGDTLVEVARALLAGGVDALEVTFTVPKAARVIEQVADALGDNIVLGAGTVLDPETARTAMLAGARFIVGPNTHLGVIETCRRYGIPVMPGALTPTEVVHAWQAGADIVKVFPADTFGPAYLKALKGPLPQVRLMPTGGVNLSTAVDFLKAGACALGAGGALVDAKWISNLDQASITQRAKAFRQIVDSHQAG